MLEKGRAKEQRRTLVVEAVHPTLRHGLNTLDRTDVVGLAIVVPGHDLSQRNRGPILHEQLPALRPVPVVAAVDPVLVERIGTVVLVKICELHGQLMVIIGAYREEPRRDGRHICPVPAEVRDVRLVWAEGDVVVAHGPAGVPLIVVQQV